MGRCRQKEENKSERSRARPLLFLLILLLRREAPGVVHAIYQGGLKYTPLAVLSRPVAGTRSNTLVITLPGSVKAVKENLGSVAPLLPRIVNLLQGNAC